MNVLVQQILPLCSLRSHNFTFFQMEDKYLKITSNTLTAIRKMLHCFDRLSDSLHVWQQHQCLNLFLSSYFR